MLTTDLDPAAVGSVGAAVVAAGGAITAKLMLSKLNLSSRQGQPLLLRGALILAPFQAKDTGGNAKSVFPLPQTAAAIDYTSRFTRINEHQVLE